MPLPPLLISVTTLDLCNHPLPLQPRPTSATTPYLCDTPYLKLQALVYDILPSTAAAFSYAIGSKKRAVFLLVLKQ